MLPTASMGARNAAGAIAGALLLEASLSLPLAFAAVLALVAGVAYAPPRLRAQAQDAA